MTILSGIILLHLLVLWRARLTLEDGMPYGSILLLTLMTAIYVLFMLFNMEPPES